MGHLTIQLKPPIGGNLSEAARFGSGVREAGDDRGARPRIEYTLELVIAARTLAGIVIVASLLLALTGPHIPGWLSVIAVGSALALGFHASLRQKRIERNAVRNAFRRKA